MKKLISFLLTAGLLTAAAAGVALAVEESGDMPRIPYYLSVSGTVVSVDEFEGGVAQQDGWFRVGIEDEDGNPTMLIINDRTYFPFDDEAEVGDDVIGFYQADMPAPMIFPPQYNAAVLVSGMPEGQNVKVDRFSSWDDNDEDYLIGRGGMFAFRVDESTEIITADGLEYDGAIEGRRLVVIYGISTRSIPELATATTVIALFEDAVTLPEPLPDYIMDVSLMPIIVEGTQLSAPAAFMAEDGVTIMVPLRAIAESLGFTVGWDGDSRAVTLDGAIRLVIGQSSYQMSDSESGIIAGAPAPVIVDDLTYVPLQFFTSIAGMNNAFSFEGQIEINNDEIME